MADDSHKPTDLDDAELALLAKGSDLINSLFVVVKTALLFDLQNKAMKRPLNSVLSDFKSLIDMGDAEVSVRIADETLFVNGAVLKPDHATHENGRFLERVFHNIGAQELQFDQSVGADDLKAFLSAVKGILMSGEDPSVIGALPKLKMVPLSAGQAVGSVVVDPRIQVLRVYAASVTAMSNIMWRAQNGLRWSPKLVRRIAYDLADAAQAEPNLMLGLLHMPLDKFPVSSHLVRVATLALVCAQEIGLPRRLRPEAALIALYHHLPYEPERRSEETKPQEEDVGFSEVDPLRTALGVCASSGVNWGLIRRVVGVYEATASSGERKSLYRTAEANDLLGRVVTLTDRYDMLFQSMPPDEALRVLFVEFRDEEPQLIRSFTNAVGLYPVGTVVLLESGARAVVVEAPRKRAQLLRPVVRLIDAGQGLVDLAQDSEHGAIVGTTDMGEAQTNVSHMFLL